MGILRLGKAGGFLALALLSLFVFTLNISFSQPILEVTVTGNTPVNQCTSNDYVITVSNTSTTEQASNVIVVATIPAGFRIDSAGGGTVVGQTITWNVSIIDPSSSWSSTITLFITCDRTTVSGQILVNVTQPVSTQGSLYVTVQPGAITITKTPEVIPASIGDTVHWTLTITSTGFGPVENVVVFDTLGPGLQFDAVQSTPGNTSGLPTVRWDKTNISALATMDPKAQVKIEVYVKVIACSGLENNADANWSCDGNSPWCETESAKASVQLILKEPVINYTLPNFQLDYCSSGTQFTIPITNSGTGVAHDFYLYVNRSSNGFDGLAVNVISPSGATYEPANNRFFLGDIPIGETDLIFTLTASNWCGPLPSGSLLFEPEYTDDCGELFKPPIKLSSYSVTGAPSLSVSKSGGPSEIFLGQPITYTITATYSGPLTCGTPPAPAGIITVVDTIPAGFTITTAGNGSGGEIPIVGANTITWTVNPATTTWPWSAQITLQTPGYGQCETYCYTEATNNVTASMTDCCGCNLSADSSQTTALQCEEYFTSSKTATSSSNFEKCKEITYTNTYTFADDNWWNGVPWTQFKFFEQMANAQTYVDNSLSITVNGTAVTGITPFFNDPLHPGWMALDFSTFPADPVRGSTLVITYNLLTGDASQPACEGSYSFYDWSILDTGKTGGQCQADQQIQETVYVTVNQSQMAISIDGIPSLIDDCDRYDVTIHVTRTSVVGAYDVFVEIPRQNYDITVTNTNPAPVSIDNSDPNWIRLYYGDMFTTLSSAQIDATVEKRCGTQPDVSSTVYWDGYCWDDNNYDKKCSATSGGHPILLRANLFIKKTPELIYATTNQVTWKIYVTNSGSGNAHNVWVEDVLDSDYRYFSSSVTDLGGNPVVVTTNANHDHNGNSINGVTWTMFEIPAGETRIITLTADIIGCTHLNNDVTTSWGCLNENCATPVSDHSMGAIPPANAVTTNTIPTSIDLCERKTVRVDVKNAGLTTVYDAEVEVFLPPGLTYVIGSGNPSDPENTSATPLKWTKTQVSALAALAPAGQTGDTVSIYFDIIANCTFPSGNRTIISQVRYKTVCAEVKLSPESRSTLPVRTPTVRIIKDGRNVTKNIPPAGSYADTVTAEPGDVVEWRLRISNTGTADAHHMEFWDVLPSNMTFSSISPAPPGGGSGTQASPWIYGDLAAGASVTYYVQATVNPSPGGCTMNPQTNTAYAWCGCDDNCRVTSRSDTGGLRTTPTFTIQQSQGPITTCGGDITATVTNNGPTAYNVTITSDLPAGFVYDSMISGPSPTDLSDPTHPQWTMGTMMEGDQVILHFRMKDDGTSCSTATPDVNIVTVRFNNKCTENQNPPQYSATNSQNVSPTKAILGVIKTPEVQVVAPGGTASWTITLTNTGNVTAENVTVTDTLGNGFSNIAAGNLCGVAPVIGSGTITWSNISLTNVSPNNNCSATTSATVGDGNVTNTVVATGECISGCDYSTSTDSATVVQVQGIFKTPDLQTAPIGQEVTFDTYVSYWGVGHSYQNVVITDTLPAGLDYVTSTYSDDWPGADPTPSVLGQTITWNLGNFTGRNIVHITLTARIQDILSNFDGVVRTNSVRTTGSEDGSPFDLSDTADVRIVEPHLTIDKAGSRTEGLPGDVVHYTITVHNDGTSNAYDVNIEDSLPAGLILNPLSVTSTPSANSTTIVGNIITWTYNTIPVGGTSILEYDEIIPPEGGTFTDTSTITQYSSLQGDSPDERDYPPVSDDWTVTAPGTDIKKITLNTQANVPSPGGIVYYTMTVTNTGSMPLNPVKLIDILPDGLTYRPGSSNVDGQSYEPNTIVNNFDGTQILTWSNIWLHTGDMNPDDTIVILFEATVDPNRIGTFVNRAIVIGTSRIGDVSDEDTSTVGVLMPAIDVIKTASPSRAKPNEKVTFTLIVTNTGQVPLNPVTVEDFLPSELVYQTGSASPPPTSIDPAPGGILLRWNLSLIVGGSTSITFNVKTTILGDFINEVKATGTPPNGSNVTDNDAAVVSVRIEHPKPPTESLKPLALNWLLDCKLCNMAPIEARLAKLGVEFKAKACCGNLTNAAERLFQLIREKGLDKTKPEEYKSALELYEQAKNCCDLAQKYFDVGNYMASINFSVKRCSLYKELFEILLKMLGA